MFDRKRLNIFQPAKADETEGNTVLISYHSFLDPLYINELSRLTFKFESDFHDCRNVECSHLCSFVELKQLYQIY